MNTPDLKRLLQTCAQLAPTFHDLIDDSQCTPEQKEHVSAISRQILDELENIRSELLEIIQSTNPEDG